MQIQLVYNFKQGDKDVSDILRGKIQMLDDFLNFKNVFKKMEDTEKLVKEEEERRSKGAK